MSRKPIVRQLPDLETLFPDFSHFENQDNKRYHLEVALRRAILSLRREETLPFYAMREISDFFGISLKTVAVVFRKLQQDGLLTVVRGSHTLIEGKEKRSRHNVKGVVGIPIPLASFIIGNDPRAFYIRLEAHLRRQGYIADFIFYRADEASHNSLTDRLLEHDLDLLFWLCPTKAMVDVMLTLQDSGVRVVSVYNRSRGSIVHQYRLDLDCGTKEAAAGWRAAGVKEIYVVSPSQSRDPRQIHEPIPAFQAESIVIHPIACQRSEFFDQIKKSSRTPNSGFVFVEHEQYEDLCNYDWRAMENFFQNHRCLLTQGPVYHPAFQGRKIYIDTIHHPLDVMAERVSSDIATGMIPSAEEPLFFKTHWHQQLNLGEIIREL